jgi:large repetitive protein
MDVIGDVPNQDYAVLPSVTHISPPSGAAAGETTVTITGTGFSGVTAVTFGSAEAAAFTVNRPTLITATSPAGSVGLVST